MVYGVSRSKIALFDSSQYNGCIDDPLQKRFYDHLLLNGFEKTRFQLVLPGQEAGIVREAGDEHEYHVRFFPDAINCEYEPGRFNLSHWNADSEYTTEPLDELLESFEGTGEEKNELRNSFSIEAEDLSLKLPNSPSRLNHYTSDSGAYRTYRLAGWLSIAGSVLDAGLATVDYSLLDVCLNYEPSLVQHAALDLWWFASSHLWFRIANVSRYGSNEGADIGRVMLWQSRSNSG